MRARTHERESGRVHACEGDEGLLRDMHLLPQRKL